MSLASRLTALAERAAIPDAVVAAAIAVFVERTRRSMAGGGPGVDAAFAQSMAGRPIAEHVEAANAQHYEAPADFFAQVLGPRMKYSSALFATPTDTLAQAEERALEETCAHADLADGQRILELGCGWGSLSLWMAERYRGARIIAVSNSASQRAAIEEKARAAGLANLTVVTADINDFAPPGVFDRVVSVEMFEHMANWRALLARIIPWLASDGRLFLHVFSHAGRPYRFETAGGEDWIANHFFTGGLMPSEGLIGAFDDLFTLERQWRWSGEHYRRTALAWLANFDAHRDAVQEILRKTYGADADLRARRWRLFFLATAGLFGARGGEAWGVSHYRLKPVVAKS